MNLKAQRTFPRRKGATVEGVTYRKKPKTSKRKRQHAAASKRCLALPAGKEGISPGKAQYSRQNRRFGKRAEKSRGEWGEASLSKTTKRLTFCRATGEDSKRKKKARDKMVGHQRFIPESCRVKRRCRAGEIPETPGGSEGGTAEQKTKTCKVPGNSGRKPLSRQGRASFR